MDECIRDDECDGYCSKDSLYCARSTLGTPCNPRKGLCEPPYVCNTFLRRCVTADRRFWLLLPGQACTYDGDCAKTHYCDLQLAKCRPMKWLGEKCGLLEPCADGLACMGDGSTCVQLCRYGTECPTTQSCDGFAGMRFGFCKEGKLPSLNKSPHLPPNPLTRPALVKPSDEKDEKSRGEQSKKKGQQNRKAPAPAPQPSTRPTTSGPIVTMPSPSRPSPPRPTLPEPSPLSKWLDQRVTVHGHDFTRLQVSSAVIAILTLILVFLLGWKMARRSQQKDSKPVLPPEGYPSMPPIYQYTLPIQEPPSYEVVASLPSSSAPSEGYPSEGMYSPSPDHLKKR